MTDETKVEKLLTLYNLLKDCLTYADVKESKEILADMREVRKAAKALLFQQ